MVGNYSRKPGLLSDQLALLRGHLASASILVHPSRPYPSSLPLLYFLGILRQGLTVEPEISLVSGSLLLCQSSSARVTGASRRTWLSCPALPRIFTIQVLRPLERLLEACFLPQHYILYSI